MSYTVPYGTDALTFTLPAGMQGTLIESASLSPQGDAIALAKEALEHPLDSPPLMDLAAKRGIKRVCIVFTDTSRACKVAIVPHATQTLLIVKDDRERV